MVEYNFFISPINVSGSSGNSSTGQGARDESADIEKPEDDWITDLLWNKVLALSKLSNRFR